MGWKKLISQLILWKITSGADRDKWGSPKIADVRQTHFNIRSSAFVMHQANPTVAARSDGLQSRLKVSNIF